jgi:hypothetical protein
LAVVGAVEGDVVGAVVGADVVEEDGEGSAVVVDVSDGPGVEATVPAAGAAVSDFVPPPPQAASSNDDARQVPAIAAVRLPMVALLKGNSVSGRHLTDA